MLKSSKSFSGLLWGKDAAHRDAYLADRTGFLCALDLVIMAMVGRMISTVGQRQ
jgi:hypothetical protein